jgi:hypothetical protein
MEARPGRLCSPSLGSSECVCVCCWAQPARGGSAALLLNTSCHSPRLTSLLSVSLLSVSLTVALTPFCLSGHAPSTPPPQFDFSYFNGIECSSTEDCCAVAEAQDANATAGTYIWCTQDGGDTWTDTFRDLDQESSLIDIAAVSPQEYWAVGGEFGEITIKNPTFMHTTNAGMNWTVGAYNLSSLIFNYAIAIDCAGGNCWVSQ